MKIIREFLLLVFFPLLISCNTINDKTIILDKELIVHGSMSNDSIYNGYMEFFNFKTGKLLYAGVYKDGIEEGIHNYYFPNGKINISREFVNGKVLGTIRDYDSTGKISSESYMYYNLPVGPITQYLNNKPKNYKFSSLDNEMLFYIDYDSIEGKKITDICQDFFFKIEYDKISVSSIDKPLHLTEILLYLPQPPKYNFNYELVTADQHYSVKKVVKEFDKKSVWDTFTLLPLDTTEVDCKYAIRLHIYDSVNNLENTMFKFLPTLYK